MTLSLSVDDCIDLSLILSMLFNQTYRQFYIKYYQRLLYSVGYMYEVLTAYYNACNALYFDIGRVLYLPSTGMMSILLFELPFYPINYY